MSKFQKGNKVGRGRPKGSQNKKTLEAKARVEKVLSMIDETLEEDIAELTASERMKTYVALLEYQLPKLQRVALANDTNDDGEKLSFEVIMNRSQINEEEAS